jgi:hypothetical protein
MHAYDPAKDKNAKKGVAIPPRGEPQKPENKLTPGEWLIVFCLAWFAIFFVAFVAGCGWHGADLLIRFIEDHLREWIMRPTHGEPVRICFF